MPEEATQKSSNQEQKQKGFEQEFPAQCIRCSVIYFFSLHPASLRLSGSSNGADIQTEGFTWSRDMYLQQKWADCDTVPITQDYCLDTPSIDVGSGNAVLSGKYVTPVFLIDPGMLESDTVIIQQEIRSARPADLQKRPGHLAIVGAIANALSDDKRHGRVTWCYQ